MSPVSDIERKICAMPKRFRDWFAEYYHATCSNGGRQMTDEEVETSMAAYNAALSHTQQAHGVQQGRIGSTFESFQNEMAVKDLIEAAREVADSARMIFEYPHHKVPYFIDKLNVALTPFTQNKGD